LAAFYYYGFLLSATPFFVSTAFTGTSFLKVTKLFLMALDNLFLKTRTLNLSKSVKLALLCVVAYLLASFVAAHFPYKSNLVIDLLNKVDLYPLLTSAILNLVKLNLRIGIIYLGTFVPSTNTLFYDTNT